VLEFMSSHPAPCFYHHCADISISAAGGPASTTSTTLASGGGSSTTTTLACATPRCSVDGLVQGAACGADTIPLAIRRELYGAPPLLEEADASRPRKAGLLRRKAKRLFRRAGSAALHASRGRQARLSAGCAAAIKATTDRLASGV
jgi:hypothetical protein